MTFAGWGLALIVGAAIYAYNMADIGSRAIRLHLRLIGASIYEFHSQTGRWPSSPEELAKTSLPLKTPYWEMELRNQTLVVVWHTNLSSDPRENAGRILAYHDSGLLTKFGRKWVCRGDLGTEYMRTELLEAKLRNDRE